MRAFTENFPKLAQHEILRNFHTLFREFLQIIFLIFVSDFAQDTPKQILNLFMDFLNCAVIFGQLAFPFSVEDIEDVPEFSGEEIGSGRNL